jgi:hypothetical protein
MLFTRKDLSYTWGTAELYCPPRSIYVRPAVRECKVFLQSYSAILTPFQNVTESNQLKDVNQIRMTTDALRPRCLDYIA